MTSELTAEQILKDWRAAIARGRCEIIEIGRQTGTSPSSMFRASCNAKVWGFRPDVLVGTVTQGEIIIKAFYPELVENRFPLPVLVSDKVFVRNKQVTINAVDPNTGRTGDTQIFLKIMAVG